MVPSGDYDYYHRQYGLPFLESEANYEQIYNGWATDTIVRQSAYRSVRRGDGLRLRRARIWNASWDDADTANDYGYGHRNWYDAIDFVGADQMTHLIDFYRGLDWQRMTYRPTGWATWTGEYAEELTDPVLRADDAANTVTVYFNAGTSSQGTLTQLMPWLPTRAAGLIRAREPIRRSMVRSRQPAELGLFRRSRTLRTGCCW